MDVRSIPTVDELTAWMRVPYEAVQQAEKLAADAYDIRQAISSIYTSEPLGVYLDPGVEKLAFICADHDTVDSHGIELLRYAVTKAGFDVADDIMLADPTAIAIAEHGLVKVAYSPAVRRVGEYLNFFPGKYPGGIPNHPRPLTAMLTSGLVGAGAGYGAGWAAEQLFPERWKKGKLRRTLAILGGLGGAAPGAVWGLANTQSGRSFNDPTVLNTPPLAEPQFGRGVNLFSDANQSRAADLSDQYKTAVARYAQAVYGSDKTAFEALAPNRDVPQQGGGPLAVNVDAMGRTLWESGASPETAGVTMAALQAAQQMPGGREPGWVTPIQMGQLAAHMGAGYVSGALVGSALGTLAGLPDETQDTLKRTGMYAGFVRAVIPKLFGS